MEQSDASYMPSLVAVLVGNTIGALKELKQTSIPSGQREFVLVSGLTQVCFAVCVCMCVCMLVCISVCVCVCVCNNCVMDVCITVSIQGRVSVHSTIPRFRATVSVLFESANLCVHTCTCYTHYMDSHAPHSLPTTPLSLHFVSQFSTTPLLRYVSVPVRMVV